MDVVLQVAMRALGFDVKMTDVLKVLRDYDREGIGKIKHILFYSSGCYESTRI